MTLQTSGGEWGTAALGCAVLLEQMIDADTLDVLRNPAGKTFKFYFLDGEVLIGKNVDLNEPDREVTCEYISSNRSEKYRLEDRFHVLIRIDDLLLVEYMWKSD